MGFCTDHGEFRARLNQSVRTLRISAGTGVIDTDNGGRRPPGKREAYSAVSHPRFQKGDLLYFYDAKCRYLWSCIIHSGSTLSPSRTRYIQDDGVPYYNVLV